MGFSLKKITKGITNTFKNPVSWLNPTAAITKWSFYNPKEAGLAASGAFGAGLLGAGAAGTTYLPSSASQAANMGVNYVGGTGIMSSSGSGSGFGSGLFGSILGSALGLSSDVYSAKNQLSQQKALQNQAFAQNLQMWHMNNEYNSPKAQMQRYEDAGLNKNLIYGSGSSSAGNSSGAPTYEAAQYKGIKFNNLMAIQNLANLQQQNELLRAQTAAALAQADNTNVNSMYKAVQTKFYPQQIAADIAQKKVNTDLAPDKLSGWQTLRRVARKSNPFTINDFDYRRQLRDKYGSNWRKYYKRS